MKIDKLMKRVGHFKSKIIVIVGVPMHRLPCRKFLCGQMQWRKGFLVAIGCQSTVQFPDVLWKHSLYGPGCKEIHLSDVYKRLYRRMTASKTWLMSSNLLCRHKHWQGVENFNTFLENAKETTSDIGQSWKRWPGHL